MTRYVVVEIARNGSEAADDTLWERREDAEEERYLLARTARLNWPDLGYRYEVREADA